jgi:hypothetical protein
MCGLFFSDFYGMTTEIPGVSDTDVVTTKKEQSL